MCGVCLKVTNLADGGRSTKVMVVDLNRAKGLDLSEDAFDAIDNENFDGYFAGNMTVEFERTDCGGLNEYTGDGTVSYDTTQMYFEVFSYSNLVRTSCTWRNYLDEKTVRPMQLVARNVG